MYNFSMKISNKAPCIFSADCKKCLLAVKTTSRKRLDDSLRWRVNGRLETGQSQVEVARSLQEARKWSPGFMELIPKKWYCHQEGQPRSPQSNDICTGSLMEFMRMTT
ncbi:hypothetical protein TNCV_4016161 [Trichonephila clavipes]|nr:hypothetical protein TNCV_4016161 [Trichonephila clavipes]